MLCLIYSNEQYFIQRKQKKSALINKYDLMKKSDDKVNKGCQERENFFHKKRPFKMIIM